MDDNSEIPGNGAAATAESADSITFLPRLAKGAMINLTGAAGRTVLLYAYTLLLARMLSVGDLGEYFLLFTIINIVGLVSTIGLDVGVVRFVSIYSGEGRPGLARRVLQIALFIGVPIGALMAALLFFLAPALRDVFFSDSETAVAGIRIFAISIPFWVGARMYNGVTQGMHRMQYQVFSRDFGEQSSKLLLSIIAILAGAGLTGVVWANDGSVLIAAVLSMFFASRVLPRSLSRSQPVLEPARKLVWYSTPLAISYMLGMILMWADLLAMGYFRTTTEVGLYGAALRVGVATSTLVLAFGTVFSPVISDLYNKNNMEALVSLLKTVTRWMFICSFPIFLLLLIFPEPILRLFGTDFAQSGEVLMVLAVGQMFNAAAGSAGFIVVMSGRSKLEMLNVCVALVVEVALCVTLIPPYGAMGAAVANTMAFVTVNLMRSAELWGIMRIHAYDREFIKPLFAGGLSAVVVYATITISNWDSGLLKLVLMASLMVMLYVLFMVLMGLDNKDKAVLQMVKDRFARASV
ncbi:MAG: flippase [Thermoleophilia bacterium]